LLSAFLLSLQGCGAKTHPLPEMVTLPGPVTGLVQELDQDGHLWLSWSIPAANMANRPLRTLDHFEVWAADYDLGAFCEGCPVGSSKVADVFLAGAAPGQAYWPGPYVWQADLRPGRVYVFRVAGFSSRGGVHPSAWSEARVWMAEPPGPLSSFSAVPDDLAVRLSWAGPPDGVGVQVQRRRVPDGEFDFLDPESDGRLDLGVAYGDEYRYRARLVRRRGETLIPGPWTGEVAVRVEDELPPPPPAFLDAAITPEGVRLSWADRGESPGVAGFYLYRSLSGQEGFARLGGLLTSNVFLDLDVPANRDVKYRLTAVDDSPRANESRPSPEAEVFFAPAAEAEPGERPVFEDPGI
jgi:hypothetical protein